MTILSPIYIFLANFCTEQQDTDSLQWIEGNTEVNVNTLVPEERTDRKAVSQPISEQWKLDVGAIGQEIIGIALAHNPLP